MKLNKFSYLPLKRLIIISIFIFVSGSVFSQLDTIKKIIFVPHPRSEDNVNQSSIPSIEKIDFTKFDMTLLGGDLTYYTTINRVSMDHCNSIFNLGSENTLWTIGNHDLSNPDLISEYTLRPRSYAYYKDKITFLVLDTEIGSSGFTSSHILSEQQELIQHVADTLTNSEYLILLHHRLLWMIGDEYFNSKIDSVGESTRQLDTSNFNAVVYPILQQAKEKGIRVICLGGDKSKINFQYSPEDSIAYIASTMGPEFSDEINHVVVLSHYLNNDSVSWNFVPLSDVEKKTYISINQDLISYDKFVNIHPDYENRELELEFAGTVNCRINLALYEISGRCIQSLSLKPGTTFFNLPISQSGLIILKVEVDGFSTTRKLFFQ